MRKMILNLTRQIKKEPGEDVLKFSLHKGLEELSPEETREIVAGQSVGYWLGYITGKLANLFS